MFADIVSGAGQCPAAGGVPDVVNLYTINCILLLDTIEYSFLIPLPPSRI